MLEHMLLSYTFFQPQQYSTVPQYRESQKIMINTPSVISLQENDFFHMSPYTTNVILFIDVFSQ